MYRKYNFIGIEGELLVGIITLGQFTKFQVSAVACFLKLSNTTSKIVFF